MTNQWGHEPDGQDIAAHDGTTVHGEGDGGAGRRRFTGRRLVAVATGTTKLIAVAARRKMRVMGLSL